MNNLSFGGRGAGGEAFAYCETIAGGMGASARVRGPYGLAGGEVGKPGRNTLLRGGRKPQTLPAKARFEIAADDVLRIETPGGGGWGTSR